MEECVTELAAVTPHLLDLSGMKVDGRLTLAENDGVTVGY
jgi:hypothetical protein